MSEIDNSPIKRVVLVDSSGQPQYGGAYGLSAQSSKILTGSAATVQVPIFGVTGVVKFSALYGIVTTTLGANNTAAYWQINDQTATPDISLATGTTLSAAAAGSLIIRQGLAAVALVLANASAGRVNDPNAATAPDVFMPFTVIQKTGGVATNIEFVYTTTDTPTSGTILFIVRYTPLSNDGAVTVL